MTYGLSLAALYLSHAVLSAPSVRRGLVARLGERWFRAVYSVISLSATLWFIWAYVTTPIGGLVYSPVPGAAWAAVLLMPLALFLMIARLSTPWGEGSVPLPPRGIYRITRFPGSLGLLLWTVLHLLSTGDTKRVLAFGVFALIAVTALAKNEWQLARNESEAAQAFKSATSLLPFGGSQDWRLALTEIGWRRPLGALLLYGVLLALHPLVLGVSPLDRL